MHVVEQHLFAVHHPALHSGYSPPTCVAVHVLVCTDNASLNLATLMRKQSPRSNSLISSKLTHMSVQTRSAYVTKPSPDIVETLAQTTPGSRTFTLLLSNHRSCSSSHAISIETRVVHPFRSYIQSVPIPTTSTTAAPTLHATPTSVQEVDFTEDEIKALAQRYYCIKVAMAQHTAV